MSFTGILYAGVMELVDVVDSKSTASDGVPVRVRPPAPAQKRPLRYRSPPCGEVSLPDRALLRCQIAGTLFFTIWLFPLLLSFSKTRDHVHGNAILLFVAAQIDRQNSPAA